MAATRTGNPATPRERDHETPKPREAEQAARMHPKGNKRNAHRSQGTRSVAKVALEKTAEGT